MKFTQIYLKPEEYLTDSQKMRVRIGSYLFTLTFDQPGNSFCAQKIKEEIGIEMPGRYGNNNRYIYDFEQLACQIRIEELLDIITVFHSLLGLKQEDLRIFVNRCFNEEALAYEMNEQGEIRFRPDLYFEENRAVTLKLLNNDELDAVREAFNNAHKEFQTNINNGKSALRLIFEANEILAKKLAELFKVDCKRLNEKFIENHLKETIMPDLIKNWDKTAKTSTNSSMDSFKDWINGMHNYRHGQNVNTYDNPPVDLTILLLSIGTAFLRFLAYLYEQKKSQIDSA